MSPAARPSRRETKALPLNCSLLRSVWVAKLAGVPNKVIARAKQILAELDEGKQVSQPKGRAKRSEGEDDFQIALTPPNESKVLDQLRKLDVNTLTPIECMNTLFELCKLAQ